MGRKVLSAYLPRGPSSDAFLWELLEAAWAGSCCSRAWRVLPVPSSPGDTATSPLLARWLDWFPEEKAEEPWQASPSRQGRGFACAPARPRLRAGLGAMRAHAGSSVLLLRTGSGPCCHSWEPEGQRSPPPPAASPLAPGPWGDVCGRAGWRGTGDNVLQTQGPSSTEAAPQSLRPALPGPCLTPDVACVTPRLARKRPSKNGWGWEAAVLQEAKP